MIKLHGLGWVPERPVTRALGRVGSVFRRTGALLSPDSGGSTREPWILNQGSRAACTGFVCAEFIYELTGHKCSPWMPWTYARLWDGGKFGALQNVGVRTSSALRAIRKHGACDYEGWKPGAPYFDYDALPPALLRVEAQRFNVVSETFYGDYVPLIVDALSQTPPRPCAVTVEVDRAIDNAGSEPVGPQSGLSRGRHYLCIRRFYRSGGQYVFECPGSWGKNYADGGIVRLSEARVAEAPSACAARAVS